jgi:hypothetical protein
MSRMFLVKPVNPADQVTVWWLSWHYNEATGQCNPSFTTLATESGRSRRWIAESISRLLDERWIQKGGWGEYSSSTNYRLAHLFVVAAERHPRRLPQLYLNQFGAIFKTEAALANAPTPEARVRYDPGPAEWLPPWETKSRRSPRLHRHVAEPSVTPSAPPTQVAGHPVCTGAVTPSALKRERTGTERRKGGRNLMVRPKFGADEPPDISTVTGAEGNGRGTSAEDLHYVNGTSPEDYQVAGKRKPRRPVPVG